MNFKRGFRRIVFVLAILMSISSAFFAAVIVNDKYYEAYRELEYAQDSVQRWEDSRIIAPYFYEHNVESVIHCQNRLVEAKNNSWLKLSKYEVLALCIVAFLAGSAGGYLGTWVVLWYGGIVIYKFIRWIALGFCDDSCGQIEQEKSIR